MNAAIYECGDIRLNALTREVWCRRKPIHLSTREFELLLALMERPGTVLSRVELQARVFAREPASNAIDVHLHHLRRKLGAGRIANVRGIGFRMAVP